jgi:hypothetical protein
MCICVYVYMCICVYVYMSYVYMCICVYVYMSYVYMSYVYRIRYIGVVCGIDVDVVS